VGQNPEDTKQTMQAPGGKTAALSMVLTKAGHGLLMENSRDSWARAHSPQQLLSPLGNGCSLGLQS
jgi:hypothetical protein